MPTHSTVLVIVTVVDAPGATVASYVASPATLTGATALPLTAVTCWAVTSQYPSGTGTPVSPTSTVPAGFSVDSPHSTCVPSTVGVAVQPAENTLVGVPPFTAHSFSTVIDPVGCGALLVTVHVTMSSGPTSTSKPFATSENCGVPPPCSVQDACSKV